MHLEHSEHEEERGLVEISMAASNEAVRSLRDRCKVRGVPGDAALSIRRLLLLVVLHSRAQKLERARAGDRPGTGTEWFKLQCALSLRSPLDRLISPYGSGRKRESRRIQLLFVRGAARAVLIVDPTEWWVPNITVEVRAAALPVVPGTRRTTSMDATRNGSA